MKRLSTNYFEHVCVEEPKINLFQVPKKDYFKINLCHFFKKKSYSMRIKMLCIHFGVKQFYRKIPLGNDKKAKCTITCSIESVYFFFRKCLIVFITKYIYIYHPQIHIYYFIIRSSVKISDYVWIANRVEYLVCTSN